MWPLTVRRPCSREVFDALRRRRDLAQRRLPEFEVAVAVGAPQRIHYLCPDERGPSGGVRMIYRHVEALRACGVDAVVLHRRHAKAPEWFASDAPVTGGPTAAVADGDLLVVPEWYAPHLGSLPAVPTVVFNQGPFYTFSHVPFADSRSGDPYGRITDLRGIMTVSTAAADLLSFAFPGTLVRRVRPTVDPAVFHPQEGVLPPRLGFLERGRRAADRELVLHLLRGHGALTGWELVPISGSEAEVARAMRSVPVFLAFGHREGFGLPVAEAMASGCHVIGYAGIGAGEIFARGIGAQVPEDDVTAYAQTVAAALADYLTDPGAVRAAARVAAQQITDTYSHDGLRTDLVTALATMYPEGF